MTADDLKRILLIMGANDPAIKMSVRHIMNRLDSNEDLSSVFASVKGRRASYVEQLIEDSKSGYLQTWRGREIDVEFLKDRYGLKDSEITPVLDAYDKSGAKVVWERELDFTTPIEPEELISLLQQKARRLDPSYAFKTWSNPRMRRVYVKVFALGSKTYVDAGYFQSYEGKPWDYNRKAMNNEDFRALASGIREQDLMTTQTHKVKHVYEGHGFEPPLDMNWFAQQKYLSRNASRAKKAKGDIPKTVERYVKEHLEKGMEESKAWAIAWSRYCQYSNPGSPRCKKDNYFPGKASSVPLAARVASYYLRTSYVAIPSRTQQQLKQKVERLVKEGLSPFPSMDPQRLETGIAQWVRSEIGDVAPISPEGAHNFVRDLVREAEVKVGGAALEKAVDDLGYSKDLISSSMMGRLVSILEDMAKGLADDAARGALRGQSQAIRLFMRDLGMEEWEAQQLLDSVVSGIKVSIPLTPDQIDIILASYLR